MAEPYHLIVIPNDGQKYFVPLILQARFHSAAAQNRGFPYAHTVNFLHIVLGNA
jgi:hypothetical protein